MAELTRANGGVPTTTSPKVIVVSLNWNGWRDTMEWLTSVHRLDYPNYEVVVVDNGSTDDSVARIRAARPYVTVLETQRNLGFAGGNNVGIRFGLQGGAEFIWLVNNDTIVDPSALTAMVEVTKDPEIGMVGSALYDFGEPTRIQLWGGGRFNRWTGTVRYCVEPNSDEVDYISGASVLFRSRMLREIGLLNEQLFFYWEDVDIALRARRAGWKCAVAVNGKILHKEGHSVGFKSPTADYLETESLTLFLFRHYRGLALAPLTVRLIGKIVHRLVRRQPRHLWSVLRGLASGVRKVVHKS